MELEAQDTEASTGAVEEVSAPAVDAPSPDNESLRETLTRTRDELKEKDTDAKPGEKAEKGERDDKGRYLTKERVVKPTPVVTKAPTLKPASEVAPKDGEAPAASKLRPPANWSAQAKEKWGTLPAEIQQEALRVDKAAAQAMTSVGELKKRDAAWGEVLAPHLPAMQANGVNPIQNVRQLLQTQAQLYQQPIQVLANLIKQFAPGEDGIRQLAAALDASPAQAARPQPTFDPNAIAHQVTQTVLGQFQQRQQTVQLERAQAEISTWEQGKEFTDDDSFRGLMGAMMEAASTVGQSLDLDQAYELAKNAHPGASAVLKQRAEAEAAGTANAAIRRATQASSSVRSQPAMIESPQPSGTLRDDLRASLQKLRARR